MSKELLRNFFLTPLFFSIGAAIVFLLAFGFVIPPLLVLGKILLLLLAGLTLADAILLFRQQHPITIRRFMPRILGINDEVPVDLDVRYQGEIPLSIELIEELPEQLQKRDFKLFFQLSAGVHKMRYHIRPLDRGKYHFGDTIALIESPLRLVKRRMVLPTAEEKAVYPSILQMREMELMAFNRRASMAGSKRLNRIGQSYEFEQITPFVEGDDFRNINWKATGKSRTLMVNQFQDERSQNLYCVISKGRAMRVAFNGLSLLDYAINAGLALSNVALKKYDKVGLITFSDKIGTALRAENRKGQLQKILEALYSEQERSNEPSYELLYRSLDRIVPNRSLVVLFTNFETPQMLERALPLLKKIRKKHFLVLVLFQDKELQELAKAPKNDVESIYTVTLANRQLLEKQEIARKLRSHGIHAFSSTPEKLSAETLNAYLELKARGLI